MKGFRLNSIVKYGVGGPEAGAISLIYAFLLHEVGQDVYRVGINQIGEGNDPEELILKLPGGGIHVNIRYPARPDFNAMQDREKNLVRLEVVHAALNRIADYEGKLDKAKLEAIYHRILSQDFRFTFKLKKFPHPRDKQLVAYNAVEPLASRFVHYILLERNGVEINRIPVYQSIPELDYYAMFFQKGKWKGGKLVLSGKENVVETHVDFESGKAYFLNLTKYPEPPVFQMLRADLSPEEKAKAEKDWLHSLPPGIAAVVSFEPN